MHKLPQVARLQSRISHRGRWCLILWSVALFGVPTWLATAQSQEVKPGTSLTATTKQAVPSESITIEFFPELSRREQEIIRELERPTTMDFTDESLSGVVGTLMERHKFNILIDKVRLDENSVAADANDINLKVSEIPLRSALKLMLRHKNLAFVIEDDVLKITAAAACEGDRITRTYPVQDLIGPAPGDFQSLMEAIKQGVAPGSWRQHHELGNDTPLPPGAVPAPARTSATKSLDRTPNTISMVPASGSLVVRQSWRGHDEVLTLLRALRSAKSLSVKK